MQFRRVVAGERHPDAGGVWRGQPSRREIADAMAEMDEDNSGSISFQELADWWQANRNSKGRGVAMMKDRAQERKWAQETKRRIAEAEAMCAALAVAIVAVLALALAWPRAAALAIWLWLRLQL